MPLIKGLLPLIAVFSNSKIKAWIELRKTPLAYPPLTDRPIWIHAASGEIEHCKSLIQELKNKFPQKSILLTYSSVSALKLFKNLDVNLIVPLPLDEKSEVAKFLLHFKPLILCVARSDLWPEVLYQCKDLKIPVLFFAVVISKTQNKFWQKFVSPWISVVSLSYEEDHEEAILRFPHSGITADGDPRCEQILSRILNQDFLKFKHKDILVLGSTWPEDDKILADGISKWLESGKKVIWAPHEVDELHLKKLEKLFLNKEFSSQRLSYFLNWNDTQILLIDRIGVLLNFYPLAQLAFVGGSFKRKVHSVLEPLLSGCAVAVGPYFQNSKEAVLFQGKGVTVILTPQDFSRWLLNQPPTESKIKQSILSKNELSSKKLAGRISEMINKN